MITSDKNPKVQFVRALLDHVKERKEAKAFVVEGVRLVEEALQANSEVPLILFSKNLSERGHILLESFRSKETFVEEIPLQLMTKIADTDVPQGIIAVVSNPELELPQKLDFVLICDQIRDPGNLGTIFRSAHAAGVQSVLLTPGTTDPYAPKVVRSAMGAHFHLPIRKLDWTQISTMCHTQSEPLTIFLASAQSSNSYWDCDLKKPAALVIGGEAKGAAEEANLYVDQIISIPMPGQMESLNAAIAAGILLFETVRQRST